MKSNDFCEATLHALASQLCVLDANGVIIFVNAAWRRFAEENPPAPRNYSLHENYIEVCDRATGENAAEARPFADGIRSILRGEAGHFELTYPCHAPGTKRWFLGRVAPMPVLGQTGVVITHTEITDRKRMQDNLRALAGHLQSAREDERRFIAREIHDHFSQVLSALKIDLVLMMKEQQQGEANDPANRIAEQLASIDATLESVILDLRNLVTRLRPEMLESVGILATMAYEVSQFQRSTGLHAQFIANTREIKIDMDSSLALYRILQEALTNVRRHAHAKNVTVRCECSDRLLTLQIEDDGRGFLMWPPGDAIPYGILSMRERASLLNGELSIVRTPAHTTLVEVHIPLGRPSVPEAT